MQHICRALEFESEHLPIKVQTDSWHLRLSWVICRSSSTTMQRAEPMSSGKTGEGQRVRS